MAAASPKASAADEGYWEHVRETFFNQDFTLAVYPELRYLFFMFLLEIIGFGMTVPVITFFILEELGLSTFHLGATLAAFSSAQVVGSLIFGRISDATGRRPVVVFCFVWCAIGFYATCFVRNFWELLITRTLAGLSGGTWPIVQAYTLDVLAKWHRSKYLGLLGATFALGMGVGPGLSAILRLFDGVTRRMIFAMSGSFCMAGAFVGVCCLQESLPERKRRPLFSPKSSTSETGSEACSPKSTASTTDSEALTRARAGSDLSDWEAINLGLTLVWWARFALSFGQFAFYSMYGPLARDLYNFGDSGLGIALMSMGCWGVFVQTFLFPAAVRIFGRRKTLAISCFFFSAGLILVPLKVPLQLHALTLVLIGLGGGLAEPSFPNVLAAYALPSHVGFASGVLNACRGVAAVLSPLVSGFLYQECGACCFQVAGVMAVISGFVIIFMMLFATEVEEADHFTPRLNYSDTKASDAGKGFCLPLEGRGTSERSPLLSKKV